MASTRYDEGNADFSSRCHDIARKVIYPNLFQVSPENIKYEENTLLGESERGKILDGEMGTDRIIDCKVKGLNGEIKFTVQERFRRPIDKNGRDVTKYRDITITEWNYSSNLPSELYKINAGIFLYGYANDNSNVTGFKEVIAVNVSELLRCIVC